MNTSRPTCLDEIALGLMITGTAMAGVRRTQTNAQACAKLQIAIREALREILPPDDPRRDPNYPFSKERSVSNLSIMNGDHAEFEQEWAGKDPKTRPDWPYPSFDAREWAEAFCQRFKITCKDGRTDDGDDMGLMIGWFANALMRGHDQARAGLVQPAFQPTTSNRE